MKIKVCGMKYKDNIEEVLALDIDFMGFIFHKTSARYIEKYPEGVMFGHTKKVGVFVKANQEEIVSKANEFGLDYLQLHGGESVEFCRSLKQKKYRIIKVFNVDANFDFSICEKYMGVSDLFLFDAKGKKPGGNGITFDWKKLTEYTCDKPFLLSGGIGINDISDIKNLNHPKCIGVDVNSGFENRPGEKNGRLLKKFIKEIKI